MDETKVKLDAIRKLLEMPDPKRKFFEPSLGHKAILLTERGNKINSNWYGIIMFNKGFKDDLDESYSFDGLRKDHEKAILDCQEIIRRRYPHQQEGPYLVVHYRTKEVVLDKDPKGELKDFINKTWDKFFNEDQG